MNTSFNPVISEEMLAAWLDGNVSTAQAAYISQVCSVDPDMHEIITADAQVEDYYDNLSVTGYDMPDDMIADFPLPHIDIYHGDDDVEPYPDDDVEPYPDNDDTDSYSENHPGNDDTDSYSENHPDYNDSCDHALYDQAYEDG